MAFDCDFRLHTDGGFVSEKISEECSIKKNKMVEGKSYYRFNAKWLMPDPLGGW